MSQALTDPTAFGLVVLLFTPIEIPLVFLGTRRAVRAWRRWAS